MSRKKAIRKNRVIVECYEGFYGGSIWRLMNDKRQDITDGLSTTGLMELASAIDTILNESGAMDAAIKTVIKMDKLRTRLSRIEAMLQDKEKIIKSMTEKMETVK